MNRTAGTILIVLGLIGIVWGGITYTTKETVVDFGPVHITGDKEHTLPLPPLAGAVALIGGIVLLGRKGNFSESGPSFSFRTITKREQ